MDKKKIAIIAIAAVLVVGAVGAGAWFFLLRGGGGDEGQAPPVMADAPAAPDGQGGGMGAPGTEEQAPAEDVPDIPVDKSVYGWDYGDDGPGTGTGADAGMAPGPQDGLEDLGSGYDEPEEDDNPYALPEDEDPDGEGYGSGSTASPAGGGISAPDIAGGASPQGVSADSLLQDPQAGGQAPGADSGPAGGTDEPAAPSGGAQDQRPAGQLVNGVSATFEKAVYSRNKRAVLVRMALPEGQAMSDPSQYMVVAKTGDGGYRPSTAIIYGCGTRSNVVVYMNSRYAFGEHAALAIVPMAAYDTVDVPEDCYVELPYGATYQASTILDGSQAEFRSMMQLMFEDADTVDTWVNTRAANVLSSVGKLGSRQAGSTTLVLGSSGSGTSQAQPPAQQPSSGTGDLGPSGTGTSAAGGDFGSGGISGGGPAAGVPSAGGTPSNSWVLNTSTKVVHQAGLCAAQDGIADEHRAASDMPLEDLLDEGYRKCQACWPQ